MSGPAEVAERAAQILDEVELAVVGKRDALSSCCSACWRTATC